MHFLECKRRCWHLGCLLMTLSQCWFSSHPAIDYCEVWVSVKDVIQVCISLEIAAILLSSLSRADLQSIVKGPGYPLLAEFAASYNITLILDWNITHIQYQLLVHNVSFIFYLLLASLSICHIDAINTIIPHPHRLHPQVTVVDLLFVMTIVKQTVTGWSLTIDPTVMTQTFHCHRIYRPWWPDLPWAGLWLVILQNTELLLAADTQSDSHYAYYCPWLWLITRFWLVRAG